MEPADSSPTMRSGAADQLEVVGDVEAKVWGAAEDHVLVRRPMLGFTWFTIVAAALSVSLSYWSEDGWKSWLGAAALLGFSAGDLWLKRWHENSRGVRLPWVAPRSLRRQGRLYWIAQIVAIGLLVVCMYWLSTNGSFFVTFGVLWVAFMAIHGGRLTWYSLKNPESSSVAQPSAPVSEVPLPEGLVVMAALNTAKEVELRFLHNRLHGGENGASKQLASLCGQGLVWERKTGKGAGSKTWYALTVAGRQAFRDHKGWLLGQPAAF